MGGLLNLWIRVLFLALFTGAVASALPLYYEPFDNEATTSGLWTGEGVLFSEKGLRFGPLPVSGGSATGPYLEASRRLPLPIKVTPGRPVYLSFLHHYQGYPEPGRNSYQMLVFNDGAGALEFGVGFTYTAEAPPDRGSTLQFGPPDWLGIYDVAPAVSGKTYLYLVKLEIVEMTLLVELSVLDDPAQWPPVWEDVSVRGARRGGGQVSVPLRNPEYTLIRYRLSSYGVEGGFDEVRIGFTAASVMGQ